LLLPVVLLVTAFIVYGSLYPWQFHAARIAGNPLEILLSSWSMVEQVCLGRHQTQIHFDDANISIECRHMLFVAERFKEN
jgi:hypothetical protein